MTDKELDKIRGLMADADNALDEAADIIANADTVPEVSLLFQAEIEGTLARLREAVRKMDAGENPRQRGDDDGVEYGHPGDYIRGIE